MRLMRTSVGSLAVTLAAIGASGCGWLAPYRMEVQQGNFLTQDKVSQLRAGLTRDQVKFLLGTPLVSDVFHADRWDYVFLRQKANFGGSEQRRLTLFFDEDILRRVEGDVVAADLKPAPTEPPSR